MPLVEEPRRMDFDVLVVVVVVVVVGGGGRVQGLQGTH